MSRWMLWIGIGILGLGTLPSAATASESWGGPGCVEGEDLRDVVREAFAAAPAAEFLGNGFGSGAAGYSVAMSREGCGVFRMAVGQRSLEPGRPMRTWNLQHIGSLTKVLTGIIGVELASAGVFGPEGLDTPVARFFRPEEIEALTIGDPAAPRCPAEIVAFDRSTGVLVSTFSPCADPTQITLRQLLRGNHGLFDFINEVDRDGNGFLDTTELAIGSFLDQIGVPRLTPPERLDDAWDLLTYTGLWRDPAAVVGGSTVKDFESSFGNTGHSLFGIVAEKASGRSLQRLLWRFVSSKQQGTVPMFFLETPPPSDLLIVHPYQVTTGAELFGLPEDTLGVYPQVSIAGNPATDVYAYDFFAAVNGGGGGAGGAVASPDSYRSAFEKLIGGDLLSSDAQALFEEGFETVEGLPGVQQGFGVFRFEDPELGIGYAKSGRTPGSECQLLSFETPGITAVACRSSSDAFLGGSIPPSATPAADLARQLIQTAIGTANTGES